MGCYSAVSCTFCYLFSGSSWQDWYWVVYLHVHGITLTNRTISWGWLLWITPLAGCYADGSKRYFPTFYWGYISALLLTYRKKRGRSKKVFANDSFTISLSCWIFSISIRVKQDLNDVSLMNWYENQYHIGKRLW